MRARRLHHNVGNAEPVRTGSAPRLASGAVDNVRDDNCVLADNRTFAGRPVIDLVR